MYKFLNCFYITPIQHGSLKCVWYLNKENRLPKLYFLSYSRTWLVVVHFVYVGLEILKRSYGIGFVNKKKPSGRKPCLGNIHGMEKHNIGFIRTENLFNSTLFQSFKSHSKLNVQLVPNYVKKYLAFPCVWQLIVI